MPATLLRLFGLEARPRRRAARRRLGELETVGRPRVRPRRPLRPRARLLRGGRGRHARAPPRPRLRVAGRPRRRVASRRAERGPRRGDAFGALREDEVVPRGLGIAALAQTPPSTAATRVPSSRSRSCSSRSTRTSSRPSEFGVLELVLATIALIDVLIAATWTAPRALLLRQGRPHVAAAGHHALPRYRGRLPGGRSIGALIALLGPLADGVAASRPTRRSS